MWVYVCATVCVSAAVLLCGAICVGLWLHTREGGGVSAGVGVAVCVGVWVWVWAWLCAAVCMWGSRYGEEVERRAGNVDEPRDSSV